jgi:hypothetical protein
MTIAGSTATFTTALPDNIGVGDVLQYDSNNNGSIGSGDAPAFISGRTSSTVYTVKTAAGGIPTARAADTTWSIFRAYTSLFNAEAGTENTAIDSNLRNFDTWSGGKDLAASGEQWNITLYANGITADTTAVTVDGWTTSASNYIKIYTPYLTTEVGTSQRHQGKWDTGKYNLSPATGIPLTISEENVRVDGLEIYSVDNHGISVDGATGASNVYISNNVIKGNATASKYAVYLNATGAASTAKIWNNLIYDYSGTSASGLYENDADWTNYLYNNTFVGNTGGINNNAGAIIAKNNIVKGSGNTVAYVGTFTTSDYNATDGTDATEGGTHSRRSQTFSFVDATNKDFHLAPADTGAKGYGVNLSADSNLAFQNDIDMQERTGLWSIGADEPRETTIDSPSMPGGSKITINMSLNDKMTNGLVGMWSFDGADISGVNAYDRSPVGTNTGTISGAVPTIGKRGQALKFDGVDDQVTVADANNLTFSTGNTTDLPFTFTAWVKRNGVPPANGFTIISKTGPDVYTLPFEYLFIIGSNEKFAMILYDNSGTYQVSRTTDSAYSNDNGQWVFYTATYTGDGASSGLSLYRNGVSVVSTRESPLGTYTAMHNSTQLFRIGADFPTDTTYGKAFMKGSLDEVRVYNRALSATEVGDLYHLGNVNITK